MSIEKLCDYQTKCGENPLWHPDEQRLYWTDIPTGRLFWYDPATGAHEQFYEGRPVGGFTFQADGSLLLFMDRGSVAVFRDGKIERFVIEEIPDEVETRFNDVIADPAGRVYCGTMPVPGEGGRKGRLYRLDVDGSLHLLLEGIGCSNGLGFTPDRSQMYYTDTPIRTIWRFDYVESSGALTNQRTVVETPGTPNGHDGMTVDAAGDIWSAQWGGASIIRYGSDGAEKERIAIPAKNVTACAFGGAGMDELYITTATAGGGEPSEEYPLAGALLRTKPGVKGVAEFRSRIGL